MTLNDLVARARLELEVAGIAPGEAALDAELLGRHVLGWDRATWLARRFETAADDFEPYFRTAVLRRASREPLAYIRGVQEFWGREFQVSPAVLIPRPETELLVEEALSCLSQRPRPTPLSLVDIGTGSGCIALTLALELPQACVFATDISEAALKVARANAARLGAADRVQFLHGSHLAGAPGPFDLIVTNPPYVAEPDRDALQPEVGRHEPSVALFGGSDGLRDIREILQQGSLALSPGAWLVVEIGYGQRQAVERLTESATHFVLVRVREDLQGIPRVAVLQRPHGGQ